MKLLTLNFLTCAVKSCKPSPLAFPLHIRDAELESVDIEFNEVFIRNVLPRVEWDALGVMVGELGLPMPDISEDALPMTTQPANRQRKTEDGGADGDGDEDAEMMDTAIDTNNNNNAGAAVPFDPSSHHPQTFSNTSTTTTGPNPTLLTEPEVRKLHELLLETQIVSGKLVCGNCGHEYAVKEGIANFLLPAHLVA